MTRVSRHFKNYSNILFFLGTIFAVTGVTMLFTGRLETLELEGARFSPGARYFIVGSIILYLVGFLLKYVMFYCTNKKQKL